ncbi:hypothetical protein Asppvi_008978 [Aspergillus pseudoviridinutans]|uniref:RING-type domain-containing protein n=1 Tax=Aspergillus pseudoviridinutans TaxID=1517512 RepID=A0A9P3BLN3_9EURO|nr:uncharacterized protein Asppvi_008978 [Aspergillus pseudoviridinutans]GIJ90029.1 hypothetical protein Asppvi_008978 [Aspergillus pseudoviridinutans]
MSCPDLSTILEVYPQCESHCYGYAPSQRRRCKMPIAKDNRDRASYLLREGTRLLQCGLSVDSLLFELAPLVLCKRFHRYQADSLIINWRAKLRAFEEQNLLAAVLKSLQEYAESRARSLAAGSAGEQRASARSAVVEIEEEEEDGSDREDEPEPESEPGPSPHRTSAESSSPAVETHVAEPTVPQTEPRRITRKPIEGDCGICMCPLQEQDADEDGEESEDSDDENYYDVSETAFDNEHDGEDDEDDEDDDDDDEDDDLDAPDDLVYCKNQCGTNYHKACIDEWLATQSTFQPRRGNPICPSCPNCRAAWSS